MPATQKEGLLSKYEKLQYVQPKTLDKIRSLCGNRYIDILLHLPTGIIDRSKISTIHDAPIGQLSTMQVKVIKHKPVPPRVRAPYRIVVQDENEDEMELLFFYAGGWLKRAFPEDEEVIISGTVEGNSEKKRMAHPDVWQLGKGMEEVARIVPNYPLTAGVSRNVITGVITRTLQRVKKVAEKIPEWLPESLLKKYNFPRFVDALTALHRPDDTSIIEADHPARARLVFDELFAWQLALIYARRECKVQTGFSHQLAMEKRQTFLDTLPFQLTGDQQKTLKEIDHDMALPEPMLRLVQGDVGSGKTIVAFLALLNAIHNGRQGVLMAPTEILALQHYENAKKWLEKVGVTVALLTGKMKAAEKKRIREEIRTGQVDLIIGTHALIQKDVTFKSVGLVVIDEQHRFGVHQRLALTDQAESPDFLVMTATPIPRTLALTVYGDMDISLIQEKPPGRKPITTKVVAMERLDEMVASLNRVLEKGEQVYWVCPLVEESEKSDLSDATARFEHLQTVYGDKVALLHGRMKPKEKEDIINAFKAGETKILVSTTVIEVGVDVPQATVMIVEHAERFGLSQLHQLRGRVGRGEGASSCILLYASPLSYMAKERLDTLRQTEDGFLLAEKDLELRGPGEMLGARQAGQLVTRLADLRVHKNLIPIARQMAEETVDKKLSAKEVKALTWLLRVFHKENAGKFLQAG
jgi:ATP-dependent DNA helicase RecG